MELYRHHEYIMIRIDTDQEEKILSELFGARPPLAGKVNKKAITEDSDMEFVLDPE